MIMMIKSLPSMDDNTNFSIFYFNFESASSHWNPQACAGKTPTQAGLLLNSASRILNQVMRLEMVSLGDVDM